MRYFTAKGDTGTTKLFDCPEGVRLLKANRIFDVLGGVDELNSFVGWARAVAERVSFGDGERTRFLAALEMVQQDLFIIQAELGGGTLRLSDDKVTALEETIERFANAFPPIHSFVIPGATELGALLDVSRAVARRVERLYVAERQQRTGASIAIAAYLNRLSSLLYVLARYANHAHGAVEKSPSYR